MVYIAEAHPTHYLPESNKFAVRAERAELLCSESHLSMPILLDDARNSVANAFRVFSDRAVFIDQGKIVFFNEPGFDPAWPDSQMVLKLDKAITGLLSSHAQPLAAKQPSPAIPDAS